MVAAKQKGHAFATTIKTFKTASGKEHSFFSLPALARKYPNVKRLPRSIRIVLESVLRHCDGTKVTAEHVEQLANWKPNAPRVDEIPFTVARVLLQDFTGVPLLVDLAAMRAAAQRVGTNPKRVEPLVPVDLVVDHSVMVDNYGTRSALTQNMKLEFERNHERYQFLKWGITRWLNGSDATSAAVAASPCTTQNSSAAKNCATNRASWADVWGVSSLGLSMTRLPAASAVMAGASASCTG